MVLSFNGHKYTMPVTTKTCLPSFNLTIFQKYKPHALQRRIHSLQATEVLNKIHFAIVAFHFGSFYELVHFGRDGVVFK